MSQNESMSLPKVDDNLDIAAELKVSKEKQEQHRKENKELLMKVCSSLASRFFVKFPTVQSFGWRQYTPYFMDGEPCHFSAEIYDKYGIYFIFSENQKSCEALAEEIKKSVDTKDYAKAQKLTRQLEALEQSPSDEYNLDRVTDELLQANGVQDIGLFEEELSRISGTLSSIDQEIFEDSFGDHCQVFVFRDKIEVEDYSDHH